MNFLRKTKYEPKVGDAVIVWTNCLRSGIEETRTQRKSFTCIQLGKKVIVGLTEYSIRFHGEDWEERDKFFLEELTSDKK